MYFTGTQPLQIAYDLLVIMIGLAALSITGFWVVH
jgi:hypothetical protein